MASRPAPSETDVFSAEKRSAVMRAVKSKDTKPELILRRALHRRGLRFRLNVRHLPGTPDLVFPRFRAIVFVHGCFWHGHDCPRGARIPKTNTDYWLGKIDRNKTRDAANCAALEALGWRVQTVWECDLKAVEPVANAVAKWIRE